MLVLLGRHRVIHHLRVTDPLSEVLEWAYPVAVATIVLLTLVFCQLFVWARSFVGLVIHVVRSLASTSKPTRSLAIAC